MIWNILQLIFCAMLFAVPMALYKSNRTFMARFYNAMVYREKARRLYVQILLILLLLFHYGLCLPIYQSSRLNRCPYFIQLLHGMNMI